MIGETLGGKYTVIRLLGEGGMGAVFEAHESGTERRVALKVVTGDYRRNPKLVRRFEVEAQAAGKLESEHVVRVLDAGHDERGTPFMVMELLAGEDLDSLLARTGPLVPEAALRIALQACLGLAEAHGKGIVHRDIKPGNIFLSAQKDGAIAVKLVDFGVAKLAEESGPGAGAKLTRTGAIIGSPLYMSPEQARTRGLDHRTDVWSLGVVLYEMLAGRTPHHDLDSLGELILAICTQPTPRLLAHAPWVDPALADAVHRALEISPDDRYQSAGEMAAALQSFLPDRSWSLTPSMLISAPEGPGPSVRIDLASAPTELALGATEETPPLAAAVRAAPQDTAVPLVTALVSTPAPSAPTQPNSNAVSALSPKARLNTPTVVPVIAGVLAVSALGLGAAFAVGWLGGQRAGAGSASEDLPPAASATSKPRVAAVAQARPSPLAKLAGGWKSESGRVYDAVAAGETIELRLRDASQLAGQGYEDGEARFVLSAIPNETATFNVEDRIRPLPPENTTYDLTRSRPTCLVTWTEVNGKPLRATLTGNRLHLELVVLRAEGAHFVVDGSSRVVRCTGLARARVSETKSTLTRM